MKKLQSEKAFKSAGLITLCLVFLFNPYIKTFDILPDFVAYFILVRLLTDIAYKAPYFAELRGSLKALGILSGARIAAMLILTFMRQSSGRVDDTVALFVLVLSAVEIYFAFGAVMNFFNAIGFLSERTSAGALYLPFAVNKKKKLQTRELRNICFIFITVKCVAAFLPEMLLLYHDPLSGKQSPALFYPYAFLIAFAAALLAGAIWLRTAIKYLRHVDAEFVSISAGICELMTEEKLREIEIKRTLASKKAALVCLTASAFLNFEITLSEFRQINLLPGFIFAALSAYGISALTKNMGKSKIMKAATLIFIGAALLKFAVTVRFLSTYEYSDLLSSADAQASYRLVTLMAAAELAALILYMMILARTMCAYTDREFKSDKPDAPDRTEREYLRGYRIKAWVFCAIGILVGGLKFARVLINSTVNYEFVSTSDTSVNTVFYSDAPWISIVIAVAVIAFGFYAVHYFGAIKDDEELKYSEKLHK